MLVDLQLSGAKPRTQKTYLREVENLAKYFIANHRSVAPRVFFSISADIPTESPSAITASFPTGTAGSPSYGGIMPTITVKRP